MGQTRFDLTVPALVRQPNPAGGPRWHPAVEVPGPLLRLRAPRFRPAATRFIMRATMRRSSMLGPALLLAALWPAWLAAQQPPAPRPFPRPPQTQTPAQTQTPEPVRPIDPAAAPKPGGEPSEATLGLPVYPAAQFLVSYDAGQGQR